MGAAFVGQGGVMPEAGPFPLSVSTFDGGTDGSFAHTFIPTKSEVVIFGGLDTEGRRLVVTVDFPTIDQAERGGRLLADAFAAVEAIRTETPPKDCAHRPRFIRFTRALLQPVAICELCGAELGEAA